MGPEHSLSDAAGKHRLPLTVVQLVPRLQIGGVEQGTIEMVDAISHAGGRAIVATEGGRLEHRVVRAGGELALINAAAKNPVTLWQNARLIARLIREQNVGVIHARSRAPAWSAYWATRSTGTPFVTTYHGAYTEKLPFKRLYNSVMARGRPVIAISEYIRELIETRHNVPPEEIVVIPRGADVSVFSDDAVGHARTIKLMEDWGLIEDDRPVIMLPGRLTRWKGGESLIEAAARLKARRGPDFLVLLVGEGRGNFESVLEKQIETRGTGDCVRLVGPSSDMAAALKLAAVVVSASIKPEAFGRVAIEAQAMNRPIIATDHGGAQETVVHGEGGWLYPPGDAEALAGVLDRALDLDPSERLHIGLAGRARVHARFTVEAMQRATIDVYERVAGRTFRELI